MCFVLLVFTPLVDILNMAKEKAKKLLETGNYERDRNFVISLINAAEKTYLCTKEKRR